jgi:hypothetical protein
MIDTRLLRKLLTLSGAALAIAAAIVAALGHLPFAGGLLLGFVLGALPVLSWSWLVSRGLQNRRTRALAVVLTVGKMAFYPAALYLLVTRPLLNPVAVFVGITGVVAVLAVGALAGTGSPSAKGVF